MVIFCRIMITGGAIQKIGPGAAIQKVDPWTAIERIPASPALDLILTFQPVDHVIAIISRQGIIVAGADYSLDIAKLIAGGVAKGSGLPPCEKPVHLHVTLQESRIIQINVDRLRR